MGRKSETVKRLEKGVRAKIDRGVAPRDLPDADLHRELVHLYETREDTFFDGSAQALEEHTRRMLELEHEYAMRFSKKTAPSPARTREGSRRLAGQPPKGRANGKAGPTRPAAKRRTAAGGKRRAKAAAPARAGKAKGKATKARGAKTRAAAQRRRKAS